uniref:Protein sprouty homolog 2 n=1 Tax=Tetraodon nigroviridis TaxID=99883 RepID=H3BZU8_TETNG
SRTWLPAGPPDAAHDEGRPPQTRDPPEPELMDGQPPYTPAVLSLDQIKITGSSNEYSDGPAAAQRPGSRPGDVSHLETPEERPNNLHNLPQLRQLGNTNSSSEGELLPCSAEDLRGSGGDGASGQRLLDNSQIIRTQPKRAELGSEELKPLNTKSQGAHSKCEDCGRCPCPDCRRPRALPSCWMCGRRCVCSAQSAVEYGTCVCCVKGLFYHCSSDDEDTCADKPFSCRQPRCCVRWTTVSLLSLLFPCLLCYLPTKGCVAVCQSCYDRVSRPGCRC